MTSTPFNLNSYFDEDFINFEYNEFESISPIEQQNSEMIVTWEDVYVIPDNHSISTNCTPVNTPVTPILNDDDMGEYLPIFTDECDDSIYRPQPCRFVETTDDTAQELNSVPDRS